MTRLSLSALLLALALGACSKAPDQAQTEAAAPDAQGDSAAGKVLAEAKCASCHGLDGRGSTGDIPHLAGQKAAYMEHAMQEYINGKRAHAALQQLGKELTGKELADIAAYYAGLPRIVPAGAASAAEAASKIQQTAATCTACHGVDGNATMAGYPTLAGQHAPYLLASLQAYKSGTRKDASMAGQVARLDTPAMEALANYYSSQTAQGRGQPTGGDPVAGEPLSGKCGACHGGKGHSSNPDYPNLAGQDYAYLVKAIKAYADGSRDNAVMKSMVAGMKDQDIQHVAAFYAVQPPNADVAAKVMSAKDWADRCDKCHSAKNDNPAMVVPVIEGQQAAYIEYALKAYRDGKREQSAMHAMGMPLTDADISVIADYYANMAPR